VDCDINDIDEFLRTLRWAFLWRSESFSSESFIWVAAAWVDLTIDTSSCVDAMSGSWVSYMVLL
jgi:uncharacterized membrane protein